jgi:hypothetical protein
MGRGQVWDACTGGHQRGYFGQSEWVTEWVTDVARPPDGAAIASAPEDRSLLIWRPIMGAFLAACRTTDDPLSPIVVAR